MLQFKALGPPAVERDGALVAGRATQRRRLALLALLSVARERGVSRDRLMGYLWPEHDSQHARHSLSQLAYAIRQDFGGVIHGGADLLRLEPALIETDIDKFEKAVRTGTRAPPSPFTPGRSSMGSLWTIHPTSKDGRSENDVDSKPRSRMLSRASRPSHRARADILKLSASGDDGPTSTPPIPMLQSN